MVFMHDQGSLNNFAFLFRDILEMIANSNPCDHGLALNLLDIPFNVGIKLARSGRDFACFQHAG